MQYRSRSTNGQVCNINIRYYTENMRNRRRENLAKTSSKKSAKSFLAKKSTKLPELSRAAVVNEFKTQRTPNSVLFSFRLGKGLFSEDFILFWDNKVQF